MTTGVVDSTKHDLENRPDSHRVTVDPQGPAVDVGRDEMNLVEFPLSGVNNRYLDGRKTVILADEVWDREIRAHVPRELAISGSDRSHGPG